MPVNAKICGLSTPETLDAAIAGGASHIGFVFYPKSPRNVSVEQAAALTEHLSRRAKVVALFVDPDPNLIDTVRELVRLDVIQLHGSEHPALIGRLKQRHGVEVWKAIPVRTEADVRSASKYVGTASRILFDAKPPSGAELPGGTGLRFDWALLNGYKHRIPWALSGGLNARNVADAVAITGATLVDVSSGVESSPGVKDVDKIATFLQAVARL